MALTATSTVWLSLPPLGGSLGNQTQTPPYGARRHSLAALLPKRPPQTHSERLWAGAEQINGGPRQRHAAHSSGGDRVAHVPQQAVCITRVSKRFAMTGLYHLCSGYDTAPAAMDPPKE